MFFSELLRRLSDSNVSYCVVGGVAVNLHGVPRMTYDIDLVLDLSDRNLRAAEQALKELGLSCRLPLTLASLADPKFREEMRTTRNLVAITFTDLADPLREVDVLVSPAMAPAEIIERAIEQDLEGVPVRVVSLPDLVSLKRASGRTQDQDDADLLERILNADGDSNEDEETD